MPHTTSAKKRLRQNAKRRERNRTTKKAVKTQIKRFQEIAATGTVEQLQQEYNAAAKKLDKAAAKRIVHPNLAARKKSQLSKVLHGKKQTAPAAG
jgi:small subunit ribosomal protein S20